MCLRCASDESRKDQWQNVLYNALLWPSKRGLDYGKALQAGSDKVDHQEEDRVLQQQQQEAALQVSLPFLTAFQHAQGHGGMNLSPADLAALQQHNLFLQQHAQQQYENDQREKGLGPRRALKPV